MITVLATRCEKIRKNIAEFLDQFQNSEFVEYEAKILIINIL